MKRLGIYGGSFSPPHLGHLHAAIQFYDEAQLDALIVMPAGKPPHKELDAGASDFDRLEMCRLLFSSENIENRNITVSDYELSKKGTSFTYLTLEHFKNENTALYLLCGSDMFLSLDTWKNPEIIFALATVFCCSREEDDMDTLLSKKAYYEEIYGAKILLSKAPPFPVSSSELRKKLMMEESTLNLLSESVRQYIFKNGLYDTENTLPRLRLFVSQKLSPARLMHVLGVEKECLFLGTACQLSKNELLDLRRAALLHDITHEMSVDAQIILMQECGEEIPRDAKKHPAVLHQYSGAVYVKNNFAFSPAVSDAIACHTTGSKCMSLFDRVLCLSDYIEEGRKYPDCVDLRERVHKAITKENALLVIEEAMLIYFERTLAHLQTKGCEIHPQTRDSYRELSENTLVKTRIL